MHLENITDILFDASHAISNGATCYVASDNPDLPAYAVYTLDHDGLPDGGAIYEGDSDQEALAAFLDTMPLRFRAFAALEVRAMLQAA